MMEGSGRGRRKRRMVGKSGRRRKWGGTCVRGWQRGCTPSDRLEA